MVIAITAVMMVVEIAAGLMSHSMALLADGWHMSTHVIAFLITGLAYSFARRHAANERFSFGTGKIGMLGGFTSAVILSIVAFLMAGESTRRLFAPLTIHFNEAIGIACVGLLVNLGCASLLGFSCCSATPAAVPVLRLTLFITLNPAIAINGIIAQASKHTWPVHLCR